MRLVLERLKRDHDDLRLCLSAMEAQGDALQQGQDADYERIRHLADYLRESESTHHPCEHSVLAFLQVRAPQAAAALISIPEEHERLERAREAVTAALDAPTPREAVIAAIGELSADQRAHMHREETSFYPAAERHLTEADWRLIEAFCGRGEESRREAS